MRTRSGRSIATRPRRRRRPSRGRPGAPARRSRRSARRRRRRGGRSGSRGGAAAGRPASSRAGPARGAVAALVQQRRRRAARSVLRSGKPCSRTTASPSSGPSSRTSKVSPSRWRRDARSARAHSHVHQVVDLALGHAGQLGHLHDRLLAAHARRPRARRPPPAGSRGPRRPRPTARPLRPRWSPRRARRRPPTLRDRPAAPRRTSSWVLVSSRHTAAARSSPNASAIAASAASVRCGASKNTIVRCSAASAASRRDRSPALRGRKPSKQNRSTGSPDTASAVSTADGPGTAVTVDVVLDRRRDQPVAGVGDARHPGVGDQQHPLAGQQRLEQDGGPRGLVALEVGHDPAADGDAEVGGRADAAAGCPRRRPRRPSPSSSASRGGASATRPIGVAARTSTTAIMASTSRLRFVTALDTESGDGHTEGLSSTATGQPVPTALRAGAQPAHRVGPARRLGRRDRRRAARVLPAACTSSAARTGSRSTRPTTPRTPGRCCTRLRQGVPEGRRRQRQDRHQRRHPRTATPPASGTATRRWSCTPRSASG